MEERNFMHPGAVLLRSRMAAIGMNQKMLANELGVTPTSVHRWWNGTTSPSREYLPDIERAVNIEAGGLHIAYGYLPVGGLPKVERRGGELVITLNPVTPGYLRAA